MPNFPFWGFPYRYPNYRYYQYINRQKACTPNNGSTINEENTKKSNKSENKQARNNYKHTEKVPFSFNIDGFSNMEKPILEILGIQLYQDDLIILGLLFFLYKEEVKDESLFISLILLLLS